MITERLSRLQKWIIQYTFKNEFISQRDIYWNYWACHNWELPYPQAYIEAWNKIYPRTPAPKVHRSRSLGGNRPIILCGGLKNLKKKNILLGWQEFALTEKGKKIAATLALEVPPEEVGLVREEWILNFKKHEEKYSTWYKNLGYASVFYSNEELNDLITKYGLRLKLNNWPILSLRNDHD